MVTSAMPNCTMRKSLTSGFGHTSKAISRTKVHDIRRTAQVISRFSREEINVFSDHSMSDFVDSHRDDPYVACFIPWGSKQTHVRCRAGLLPGRGSREDPAGGRKERRPSDVLHVQHLGGRPGISRI